MVIYSYISNFNDMAKQDGYAVSTRTEGYKIASNIHVYIYVGRPLTPPAANLSWIHDTLVVRIDLRELLSTAERIQNQLNCQM